MRWRVARSCLCVVSVICVGAVRANDAKKIATVEDLWHGIDPDVLALEIETIKEWEEDGLAFQKLRFTGESVGDARVRVFAIQGAPRGAKSLPGVLHIHGGGQTASLDWVRFWAKRGYVCVSFDFCGTTKGRTEVTDWGPIRHANMAEAAGGFQLRPSPRESSWFHWAVVARRALTVLSKHPQVDPSQLGIFGISVGGSLTWMVAAADQRVKAAVPIYGCGYNYDRRNVRWGLTAASPDLLEFQRVLSSEAHAPFISCPVLFLSATNDFHGLMDRSFETLAATRGPKYQVFTPRTNHHIEPADGADLPLWMDWHLKNGQPWPKSPEIKITLGADGIPLAMVTIDRAKDATGVEVFHSFGDKRPQARYWRTSPVTDRGGTWQAVLPVLDTWDDLRAFATVTYKTGVRLSTPLRHDIPAQLGRAKATLTPSVTLADGLDGLAQWTYTNGYTDPVVDWHLLAVDKEPEVGSTIGMTLKYAGSPVELRLTTHIIGDPQFQCPDGKLLAFSYRGGFTDAGLTVTVTEDDWGTHNRVYTAKFASEPGAGWHEVQLPLAKFLHIDGRPPARWSDLDKLTIQGKSARDNAPRIARLRWVDAK